MGRDGKSCLFKDPALIPSRGGIPLGEHQGTLFIHPRVTMNTRQEAAAKEEVEKF